MFSKLFFLLCDSWVIFEVFISYSFSYSYYNNEKVNITLEHHFRYKRSIVVHLQSNKQDLIKQFYLTFSTVITSRSYQNIFDLVLNVTFVFFSLTFLIIFRLWVERNETFAQIIQFLPYFSISRPSPPLLFLY